MSKKIIPYDDYHTRIPPSDKWDEIGTITQTWGHSALRNGWKIIEVEDESEDTASNE